MFNKRGISPLIATVLLIGFTIAIAAMVSTFLIEKTKEDFNPEDIIKDTEYCSSVALGYKIQKENGEYLLDWIEKGSTGYYVFEITNKGTFTIQNLTVAKSTDASDFTQWTQEIYDYKEGKPTTLIPEGKVEFRLFYPSAQNPLPKVEITPWINDPREDAQVMCAGKKLVIDLQKVKNSLPS